MDTDSNQSTIVPNGANSAGASKRTKLPTALLVARKRDAPLDERAITEYFGQNFGPVVSCHLGSRKNYKMRLQFASQASLAKAASQKIVNVGDVKIRVLHADTGPAVKKHFDIRESFRFKEAKSLDEQAVVIHNENRIHSVKGHLSFCQKLETHLQKYFNVTIRIKMFGSSATGFGWNSSDIDITLIRDGDAPNSGAEGRSTGPSPENGDGQSVEDNHSDKEKATMLLVEQRQVGNRIKLLKMIGKFLNNFPLVQRSVVIPSKHCPILLFRNALKLQCEMSIENLYGLTKTAWLNYLSLVHGPWLPRLFSTVRYWLSFHLNATTRWRTKFNSYCLLLILVTYLQTEGLIEPASEYSKDKEPVKNSTAATESGLITRLFLGFVNFLYGTSAYWEHCVFRPRLGIVERNLSGFMLEHSDKFKYSWLNVEDPFEVEHNPGSTIVYTVLESLKIILMNAREELQSPSSLLPLRPIHKCLPSCRRLLKETMSARRRELSIKPDQQLYNRIQRYINGLDKSTLNSEYIVCLFYECCVRCLLTLLGPVLLFEITQPQVADESMQHLMEELVVDPSKAGDRFGPWPLKVTCRSTACTWQDRTNRAYKLRGSVYKQYPFPSETELSRRIAAKESRHKNENEGTLQFEMEAELKNDDNIMSVSVRFHSACSSAQLNRFLHCYMIFIKKYLFTCFEHFLPLPE